MKTRIVGLGNELLRDDAVGLQTARLVRQRLGESHDIEFHESPVGGLRLLDVLLGCERAILLDAVVSNKLPPGSVVSWRWEHSAKSFVPFGVNGLSEGQEDYGSLGRRYHGSHDTDLASALRLAERLNFPIPREVILTGIVTRKVFEFGIGLDPAVASGRDHAADIVVRLVESDQTTAVM